MLKRIRQFINENALLTANARVVVGLSGGADSVCLAYVLRELGYEVVAVHCNFHLRGEESNRDEAFVLSLCDAWGVECVKVDFDTIGYASVHGLSIEMAARELRYDFFRKVMSDKGCEVIAVGHHQDDNVETMLLNLARGAGLRGLCAIQPRNGDVVRPLLCVSRREIEMFLDDKGLQFVTDHTNMEDAYARNKVRLNVVPELERINAGARGNIIKAIENLCEVSKVYEAAINQSIDKCCTKGVDGIMRIDVAKLMNVPSPMSLLHELLAPYGFNRDQVTCIVSKLGQKIEDTGSTYHSATHTLLVDRECLLLAPCGWDAQCEGTLKDFGLSVQIINRQELKGYSSDAAYLDADKIRYTLAVRTPRRGDTFAPFGMRGKRKLISDFLTDQKVSLIDKARQLLVCDGEEIVWVVGRRSSDLYRVTDETQRVIVIRGNASLLPED